MKNIRRHFLFLAAVLLVFFRSAPCEAADVLIVGDIQLRPVSDVVEAVEKALPYSVKTCSLSQANGRLRAMVSEERAKVVVALGREALDLALALPESVPVVYGMLVTPPRTHRQNVTGVCLATSIDEYAALIGRSFPHMRRVGVIYGQDTEEIVKSAESPSVRAVRARNAYEFVSALGTLAVDAFLLLPDRNLLTPAALEEVYLYSFRRGVPVLGISEKHVKEGSLLALVFDTEGVGRQLGETVRAVLSSGSASGVLPALPQKLNLFINTDTARKMNIPVPDELLRRAKKVYR